MKIIEFKKYENVPERKKLNRKKVGLTISLFVIFLIFVITFSIYVGNRDFRNFMDKYVLRKSINENTLPSIEIENSDNIHIFAYGKYIAILEKNRLKQYNSSANEVSNLEINVSNPITATSDRYALIAEKDKQRAYLVSNSKIIWQKEIEGTISRVNVNNNGYSSIIVSGTTYKSVIITYDNTGKELFKTYLSTSIATDATISNDNKYMSFAEADTSGTLVQYKIKTVEIEMAKQSPDKAIIQEHKMELDELVINMEYHDKNRLVVMCNDGIWTLFNGKKEKIVEYNTNLSKITFSGIKLDVNVFKIEEIIYGPLNQASNLEITNTTSNKTNLYTINGVAKEVYSKDDIIAVNIGNEVYFVKTNGWLVKKYISSQEVKEIVVSCSIAGIIYRNKIEILGL